MAPRNPTVQRRFRLKKELLGRLEREAKRRDHSLSDEVGRRLEDSFRLETERQEMAEERQRMAEEGQKLAGDREEFAEQRQALVSALMHDVRSHHDPKATKAVLERMEESAERYTQSDVMSSLNGDES
jgi:hypothetical protein